MIQNRKEFLKNIGLVSAGMVAFPGFMQGCSAKKTDELFFDLSLAEWSLNKALFAGDLTNMEFPEKAKAQFGISAVEYVNQFFKDKAQDKAYLNELNQRCEDLGVNQLLIMVDGEGDLAVTDEEERRTAIENHYKWVEAADHLNCHSIRVNVFGDGSGDEIKTAAIQSLGQLSEFAKDVEINIIVENHGGWSSDAEWLVDVLKQVDMKNCGTLPDFGNFCVKREGGARWDAPCTEKYDRYKGVKQMMPYAKGVSAKSYDFNEEGNETTIDYGRMLKIIKQAEFKGHIGIEYEGQDLPPDEGIMATKELLTRLGQQIS